MKGIGIAICEVMAVLRGGIMVGVVKQEGKDFLPRWTVMSGVEASAQMRCGVMWHGLRVKRNRKEQKSKRRDRHTDKDRRVKMKVEADTEALGLSHIYR